MEETAEGIQLDILDYPSQETTDPDPITALQRYIKGIFPDAVILGLDKIDTIKAAGADAPVFYCRLESLRKNRETNTVAWMDAKIAVYVIRPEPDIRLKIVGTLAGRLSLDGEVIMLDHSPMRIKRLHVENKSDYLKEGQLFVTVHYGLLRSKEQPPRVMEIVIGLDQEESWEPEKKKQ